MHECNKAFKFANITCLLFHLPFKNYGIAVRLEVWGFLFEKSKKLLKEKSQLFHEDCTMSKKQEHCSTSSYGQGYSEFQPHNDKHNRMFLVY